MFQLSLFSGQDRRSCFVDLRNRVSTMPYHFYYLYSSSQVIEQNRIEPYMIKIQAKKPSGCSSIWKLSQIMRAQFVTLIQRSICESSDTAKPKVRMASPDSRFSTPVSCINCCIVVHVVVVPTTTAVIKPFPSMRSALRK